MTLKSDFLLLVRPVTEQFVTADEMCAQPICPYAYNSVGDWYIGGVGPTFIGNSAKVHPAVVLIWPGPGTASRA
jgi:hypothetical protein